MLSRTKSKGCSDQRRRGRLEPLKRSGSKPWTCRYSAGERKSLKQETNFASSGRGHRFFAFFDINRSSVAGSDGYRQLIEERGFVSGAPFVLAASFRRWREP